MNIAVADKSEHADSKKREGLPVEFGGQTRYCMRCGKRAATHIMFSSQGRKQYRCDECFECGKKS